LTQGRGKKALRYLQDPRWKERWVNPQYNERFVTKMVAIARQEIVRIRTEPGCTGAVIADPHGPVAPTVKLHLGDGRHAQLDRLKGKQALGLAKYGGVFIMNPPAKEIFSTCRHEGRCG
jgi:hypothetical protein